MGNPPFVGYSNHSPGQKEDRAAIFGQAGGVLDYVACWYKKSADYIADFPIYCALVSTNSITQGQQVTPLWKPLTDSGIGIDFAHRSFLWSSEGTGQALVYVVIIGFSHSDTRQKLIFTGNDVQKVDHINAYLANAQDTFVERRVKPLCAVPEMVAGGKPTDGGFLILNPKEKTQLLSAHPELEPWVKRFSMGEEFINGKDRYCLWFVGITPQELQAFPQIVLDRINGVRAMRLASTKEATRKKADTPWLFDEVRPPDTLTYIGVPKVSSERRRYIPLGFVSNGMIPGDKLYFVPTDSLYYFGILMSQVHNAWMRVVTGRLKSDYRYSNTIVYNNFMWPNPTDVQKTKIEMLAQAVLDAREKYPNATLAQMYDPDKDYLFPELTKAHKELDKAVEEAYGVKFNGNEEKIVAHLFKLYADATS